MTTLSHTSAIDTHQGDPTANDAGITVISNVVGRLRALEQLGLPAALCLAGQVIPAPAPDSSTGIVLAATSYVLETEENNTLIKPTTGEYHIISIPPAPPKPTPPSP